MMALRAVEEVDAAERMNFVADMTAVVGSLFSKDNPVADHMISLGNAAAGVREDGEQQ